MDRRTFLLAPFARTDLADTLTAEIEKHKIPGLALAVLRGRRVDFRGCYGVCEAESRRAVDPGTIFEAASLSKPVFATAVLQLAAKRQFDLDHPLLDYLGGTYIHVQQPWNPDTAKDEVKDPKLSKLTARLVLSHRTGLPNWRFSRPLDFIRDPGQWGYSGEGFVILQRAVEKKTGLTLDDIVAPVLRKAGMPKSRYLWSDSLLPNVARGHNEQGKPRPQTGSTWAVSAGSLVTTLDEYARFLEATLKGKLLGRDMQKDMLTAVSNTESAGLRWGLGWGLPLYDGEQYLFHWGSNPGYKCFVLASLKSGDGILFFTNSEHGLKILPTVVPAVFGKELPLLKWRMLQ